MYFISRTTKIIQVFTVWESIEEGKYAYYTEYITTKMKNDSYIEK
jgi:hypothetical protein